jgi:hypothetical protein
MEFSGNTHGIARIVQPTADGRGEKHVGMAVVLGPRHVMTCCHVLNDALGRQNRLDPERPPADTRFSIRFPYASNAKGSASIIQWGLELPQARDVAVLELIADDVPADAGVAAFNMRSGSASVGTLTASIARLKANSERCWPETNGNSTALPVASPRGLQVATAGQPSGPTNKPRSSEWS